MEERISQGEIFVDLEDEPLQEKCGIFTIFRNLNSPLETNLFLGIRSVDHRGPDDFGITTCYQDGVIKKDSLKSESIYLQAAIENILSNASEISCLIGHSRYATTGDLVPENIQPIQIHLPDGGTISVAHNGNIPGLNEYGDQMSDTYRFTERIAKYYDGDIDSAICNAINSVKGAYSFVIHTLTNQGEKLYVSRDPHGIRPLEMGRTKGGDICFASETISLEKAGVSEIVRSINPGEVSVVRRNSDGDLYMYTLVPGQEAIIKECSLEEEYFKRPDSMKIVPGLETKYSPRVADVRKMLGEIFAGQMILEEGIDLKSYIHAGIPDSGLLFHSGVMKGLGIPGDILFKRDHNARSFLQANAADRQGVTSSKLSLAMNRIAISGKKIMLYDDSLIRGNAIKAILKMLTEYGVDPRNVELNLAFPPVNYGCHLGINMGGKDLIAPRNQSDPAKIAAELGIAKVRFATPEMIQSALRETVNEIFDEGIKLGVLSEVEKQKASQALEGQLYCFGCHTGEYPVPNIIPIQNIK